MLNQIACNEVDNENENENEESLWANGKRKH